MAAKRKSKKRGAHGRAGRQQTSPPPSPALAQKALRSGHYREAVAQFKGLLKNEPKAEWREGLAAAYADRARELEAKGMLKEALAIWENRRQLHPSDPLATEHVTLLLRLGQVEQAGPGLWAGPGNPGSPGGGGFARALRRPAPGRWSLLGRRIAGGRPRGEPRRTGS
jgi:tetratricopeptide (TPR) repeat protein